MPVNSGVWREGIVTGLLGAAGVALWFLGVDIAAGRPFHTPATLGAMVWSVIGSGFNPGPFVNAAAYTVIHVAVFVVFGVAASTLVDMSRRMPHITVGLLLFFVVFEVGFYFVALALSEFDILATLGWYHVGAANLIAAALMGGYLWRRHPELKATFKTALDGRA